MLPKMDFSVIVQQKKMKDLNLWAVCEIDLSGANFTKKDNVVKLTTLVDGKNDPSKDEFVFRLCIVGSFPIAGLARFGARILGISIEGLKDVSLPTLSIGKGNSVCLHPA